MKNLSLSPEIQFLLCYSRTEIDEKVAKRAEDILEQPLNWDYLLKTAYNHGVAPLLYNNLKKTKSKDIVPKDTIKSLEAIYYATAFNNMQLLKETGKVLNSFNYAKIKVISFKGPSLVKIIYKNPALRPFLDIDLLISKDDLPKVIDILKDMGYSLPEYLLPLELYTKYHFHLLFIKKNGHQTNLEIHWDLKDNFKYPPMGIMEIWRDARQVEISGAPAMIMAPEDLLIYLCHHIDRHGYMNRFINTQQDCYSFILNELSWNRLIWFVDVYEVIKYYGKRINWMNLIEKSNRWDKNGSVASSLHLTNQLFQVGLEPHILNTLNPPIISTVEGLLYKFIIRRASNQERRKDFILKFYERKITRSNKRFVFRPIRLIELNYRLITLFVLFPFELAYHIIKRFISKY